MRIDDLVRDITALDLLGAAELARQLQARLGVELPVATPRDQRTDPVPPPPPPVTEYTLELTAVGERKVQVMRVLRERMSIALTEARNMIERAPVVVASQLTRADADAFRADLEQAGATITVRT